MTPKPPRKGIYCLILRVPRTISIYVGALGRREFHAGFYVYTGSALNSLVPRVSRHLSRSKKKHWHIDYLTTNRKVQAVGVGWKPTARNVECRIARRIGRDALGSQRGFGSGGCNCDSHLHYFPDLGLVRRTLLKAGILRYSSAGHWLSHVSKSC